MSPSSLQESTMAEASLRSSAAELSVTSNGDLDQSPQTVFQRVRVCSETLENCNTQGYMIYDKGMC